MTEFLAVFTGSNAAMKRWMKNNKKTRDQMERDGMVGWGKWIKDNKKSVVMVGSPLGATKLVNRRGVSKYKNELVAWCLVRAKNHQAAANMFKKHPHFMLFPGDAVEVMECLDIPKM